MLMRILGVVALVSLTACSGKHDEGKLPPYSYAKSVDKLELPPELSAPKTDDSLVIPPAK